MSERSVSRYRFVAHQDCTLASASNSLAWAAGPVEPGDDRVEFLAVLLDQLDERRQLDFQSPAFFVTS